MKETKQTKVYKFTIFINLVIKYLILIDSIISVNKNKWKIDVCMNLCIYTQERIKDHNDELFVVSSVDF